MFVLSQSFSPIANHKKRIAFLGSQKKEINIQGKQIQTGCIAYKLPKTATKATRLQTAAVKYKKRGKPTTDAKYHNRIRAKVRLLPKTAIKGIGYKQQQSNTKKGQAYNICKISQQDPSKRQVAAQNCNKSNRLQTAAVTYKRGVSLQ